MAKLSFYTNESVHIAVAEGLKRREIMASTARDAGNLGFSDVEQLEYAKQKRLVIVTHDDDFLSLATTFGHAGSEKSPSVILSLSKNDGKSNSYITLRQAQGDNLGLLQEAHKSKERTSGVVNHEWRGE